MPKTCKYYCEQCGDCLECNEEFECFYGGDHSIELQYKIQQDLLEQQEKDKEDE